MRPQTARSTKSPLLTVPELASLIGVNRSTLYRAINRGDLSAPDCEVRESYSGTRAAAEKLILRWPACRPVQAHQSLERNLSCTAHL